VKAAHLVAWAVLALASASFPGCSHRSRWMYDESYRIDEGIKPEKFSNEVPGATGTSLAGAPPIAPAPAQGYSLAPQRGRPERKQSRRGAKSRRTKEEADSANFGATGN